MRDVKGYVFIPRFENHGMIFEPLFGPNQGRNGKYSFDNLENNGINVFTDYSSTASSARQYIQIIKDCKIIRLGKLKIEIAESEEDAERFRRKSGLIVIMKGCEEGMFQNRLLGPLVEGKLGFGAIPGGFLSATDFETYTFANSTKLSPFERAKYLASEVHRQGQCGATIAKFSLKRLKRILFR